MRDTRPLATPQEVAEFLRKPPRTLEQWRYRKVGPPFHKVGREVRYRWADVERWLDEQAAEAA